jgi:hypothetical protein
VLLVLQNLTFEIILGALTGTSYLVFTGQPVRVQCLFFLFLFCCVYWRNVYFFFSICVVSFGGLFSFMHLSV